VTSSRVEVRWRPATSRALTTDEKERVVRRLASRLDGEGRIRVTASDTRSQLQNRALAEKRLAALVAKALVVPKKRVATKPSRAAKERRIQEKKRRGERKRERGRRLNDD
jgi:ribosome-associated protein